MTKENPQHGAAKVENEGAFVRFLRATEIDARLLGMIAALVLIWVGFHVYGQMVNEIRSVSFTTNSKVGPPFRPSDRSG